MMCYKDRCYCQSSDCDKYPTCDRNYDKAVEEKAQHPDRFIRETLGIMVRVFSKCYEGSKQWKQ